LVGWSVGRSVRRSVKTEGILYSHYQVNMYDALPKWQGLVS